MTIFDIDSAASFFAAIKRRHAVYLSPLQNRGQTTEDLLFVIMGLNHLREWIAPESGPTKYIPNRSSEEEQNFSTTIYENPNHEIVREICNATKHFKSITTTTTHGALIDDWHNIDDVAEFDKGPPTGHSINGEPIEDLLSPLVELYEQWFSSQGLITS